MLPLSTTDGSHPTTSTSRIRRIRIRPSRIHGGIHGGIRRSSHGRRGALELGHSMSRPYPCRKGGKSPD